MFERKVSRIAAFAASPGAVNLFCKRDTGASSFPGVLPGKEAAMAAPIKPQIATTVRTFSAYDRFTLRVGRTGGVRNLRSRGSSVASSLQVGCRGKRHTCERDRKSTRLNSSHPSISYAVFCLKKKNPTLLHPSFYQKQKTKTTKRT